MSEFKLRSGNKSPFKQMGSSPTKHSTNRSVKMMKETVDGKRLRIGSHEEKYGKGHDNSAHPNYWKKERGVGKTDKEKEQKTTARYGVDNRFSLEEQKKREKERTGSSPAKRKKVDPDQYQGDTESSTANRNIRRGKQEKQRTYVEGINEKLGGTKKEKRAQKRVMNKSEKIRKRTAKQEDREKRTGSKEGKGVIGKLRKKVIDVTQKQTSKKINKNIDKMTSKQAFNTARRYVPGKTYTKGGKVYNEKTRQKDNYKEQKPKQLYSDDGVHQNPDGTYDYDKPRNPNKKDS